MENLPNSSWILSKKKRLAYQIAILSWYDQNKRELPWRVNPTLYKTVISEFMLQQTRVTTALPYFENWMIEFPDFFSLSQASEKKVLKAWEGLGYYSRARNLHLLSKIAVQWEAPPLTLDDWKNLPGVGPYIAAAVTSIALGQKQAVCDGNVVRALTRLFAISESFKDGSTAQKKIRPVAQALISSERPGDYNQAIMELGATICHRSSPLCSICPVLTHCKAGKSGEWTNYPALTPKPKKTATLQRYWIEGDKHILLHASQKKRLAGVFELPEKIPNFIENSSITPNKPLTVRKRTIGNTEYTEEIFRVEIFTIKEESLPSGYAWMKWSEMKSFTLSGPHRKWINEIKKSQKE